MGRRLGIDEAQLQIRHRIYDELPEMGQCMLRYWKGEKGSAATLQPWCDCDASKLVQRRDSVEEFCYRDRMYFLQYNILLGGVVVFIVRSLRFASSN